MAISESPRLFHDANLKSCSVYRALADLKESYDAFLNIIMLCIWCRDGHFCQFLISIIDRFQKLLIKYAGGGACVGGGAWL